MVRQFEVSLSHYRKIDRGVLDVRLSTAKKLAAYFNVTLSELLRASGLTLTPTAANRPNALFRHPSGARSRSARASSSSFSGEPIAVASMVFLI